MSFIKLGHEDVFISKGWTEKDLQLFLGPFCEDERKTFIEIQPEWTTVAHLMHRAGKFASVSEARKNGWNIPIPIGFSSFSLKKKRFTVSILNGSSEDLDKITAANENK